MNGLTLTSVRRAFGSKVVLDGLSLEVAEGEFIAVLGHSGCGKSTLLRIVAGLDSGYTGRVEAPVERAMVFQDSSLLPWKRVLDNVILGVRSRDADATARRVLDEVGLASQLRQWPSTLSGGEAQRVALARALVRQPKLLLLDEPFGALDALNRLRMQDLMLAMHLKYEPTALMVTHDVEEAIALADRILVLSEGRFIHDQRVDISRPRDRTSGKFQSVRAEALRALGVLPRINGAADSSAGGGT
jgi:sulfonate transport system ATP-binding protein